MSQNGVVPGRNLWKDALDSLDSKLQSHLTGIVSAEYGDIATSILKEAEKKKNLCLQKRWRVRLRGRTIVLRDILDKIITWVSEFRAVVDVAAQYDPTAASLPWTGVRFLLQLAVNDHHCFESTLQGLEFTALLVSRYAAFEVLYLEKGASVQRELEGGLVRLYARILTFLASAIHYFKQPTPVRMAKGIFQQSQDDDVDKIREVDEGVFKLAGMVDSHVQQQTHIQANNIKSILRTLENPICRLVDASMIYTKQLEEKQFHNILNWLSSVPYPQHHKRHSDERLPDSTQWLFRHPQYMSWKSSSSSSVMLLHGIPGSGKTTIVSAVIDAFLREHSINQLSAPIAYFYCGDSRFGRAWADPDEIMRSLTRQFAVADRENMKVHEQAFLEYSRREAEAKVDGFEMPKLRSGECAKLLLDLLGANPSVIIVDGVDEVEEHRRHELLNALIKLRDESTSVVKIFLSSRDNSNIFAGVPDALMLRVQDVDTRSDMEVYVRHCVSSAIETRNLLNGCVSAELREDLISFLLDRAGEMFLWVKLQIQRFTKLKSAKSISEALHTRADDNNSPVSCLYADILEQLRNEDPVAYETAARAFSWLLCTYEPLSTAAFVDAVSAVEISGHKLDLQEILTVCSNLIVVDSQLDTLRFAHVSFKEFLESKQEFGIPSTHSVVASGCLNTVMEHLPLDFRRDLQPDKDFTLYATIYWARHYRYSSAGSEESLASKLTEFIFDDGQETSYMFQLWLEAVHEASQYLPKSHSLQKYLNAVRSESSTPFFTACVYGLEYISHQLAEGAGFDINMRNSVGHTGLYLAAAWGHNGMVRLLLDLGADPDVQCGNFGNALSAACAAGHTPVIRMLLEFKDLVPANAIEAALGKAFLAGHESIVRMLLGYYLRAPEQAETLDPAAYEWLLESAATNGFTEVVEDLSKAYPSPTKPAASSKIINAIIRKGRIPLVKRYMNSKSLPADTIATAALFGKNEIITLCLDNGFDIEYEGSFGTPLRSASLMGYDSCVRLLLSCGADVNTTTKFGDALQAAAMKGHLLITDILIKSNVNVRNLGGFFGNALQAAAYRGHREIVQVLVNAGAGIGINGRYEDAFHAAAAAGNADVIKIFIENGYYITPELGRKASEAGLKTVPYRDLLREASPDRGRNNQRKRFVDNALPSATICDFTYILDNAGSTNILPIEYPPAVHNKTWVGGYFCIENRRFKFDELEAAAAGGHAETIQTVISNRKRLRVSSRHFGPVLWAASAHGHKRVVDTLISADLDLAYFIRGALECAGRYGHAEVIEVLLEYANVRGASCDNRHCVVDLKYVKYKSPCVLPLVLSGCQGGQLRSVLRGFEAAQPEEIGKLSDVVITEAAKFNSTGILEHFLQDRAFLNPWLLMQAMRAAATHGSKSALVFLVSMDRITFAFGYGFNDIFADAVRNRQAEIVQYLIDRSVNRPSPQFMGEALLYAALKDEISILGSITPVIRDHQSYQTVLDRTLTGSSAAGFAEAVEFLVKHGANTNAVVEIPVLPWSNGQNNVTETALQSYHYQSGLRRRDRSPEKKKPSVTPLQACLEAAGPRLFRVRRGEMPVQRESVVNLLVDHGANVNGLTANKTPLFHIVVERCTPETVRKFISHGADLNSRASDQSTPLDAAVGREVETLPVVRVLLEAGVTIPIELSGEHQRYPILDGLLNFFASHFWDDSFDDSSDDSLGDSFDSVIGSQEFNDVVYSKSVEQILLTGPGAVIKLLLLQDPELRATDTRYGLLLQMIAVMDDRPFLELLIQRGVDVNLSGYYYGCAIQAAARYAHLECVHALLNAGSEVNISGGAYGTALRAAVVAQHQEVVDLLISHGADVNLPSPEAIKASAESPPLELAIKSKNINITRSLLLAGPEVQQRPCALQLAVETGSLELTEMLVDFGARADGEYDDNAALELVAEFDGKANEKKRHSRELHTACFKGHYGIARLLLERGAYPDRKDKQHRTALAVAASGGYLEIMELLLEFGAEIYHPAQDINVLTEALKGQNGRKSVQFLVQKLGNSTELVPACRCLLSEGDWQGDEGLLLWVLDKVPLEPGPLSLACRFGFKDAVKMMLLRYNGPNCDLEHGERALDLAAYYQEADIVSFLIEQGADVGLASSKYGSAISAALEGLLASGLDHKPVGEKGCRRAQCPCSIILEEGGKVWIKFYRGAIHEDKLLGEFWRQYLGFINPAASFHDSTRQSTCERIIRALFSAGAEVNTPDRPLGPPLHVASFIGSVTMVELLVQHGADVNESGGFFGTALIAAACGDQPAVLDLLLARGVDVNVRSEKHLTALRCAREYMDSAAVRTLVEHGAVE